MYDVKVNARKTKIMIVSKVKKHTIASKVLNIGVDEGLVKQVNMFRYILNILKYGWNIEDERSHTDVKARIAMARNA